VAGRSERHSRRKRPQTRKATPGRVRHRRQNCGWNTVSGRVPRKAARSRAPPQAEGGISIGGAELASSAYEVLHDAGDWRAACRLPEVDEFHALRAGGRSRGFPHAVCGLLRPLAVSSITSSLSCTTERAGDVDGAVLGMSMAMHAGAARLVGGSPRTRALTSQSSRATSRRPPGRRPRSLSDIFAVVLEAHAVDPDGVAASLAEVGPR